MYNPAKEFLPEKVQNKKTGKRYLFVSALRQSFCLCKKNLSLFLFLYSLLYIQLKLHFLFCLCLEIFHLHRIDLRQLVQSLYAEISEKFFRGP